MESLNREITFELPTDFSFKTIESHFFESSTIDPASQLDENILFSNNFFKKLTEQFANSHNLSKMDVLKNTIVLNTDEFDGDEYNKFMNEIWIGIVVTLIVISMVFCICSCFLYHQFRLWKRNFRSNMQNNRDLESAKLNPDMEDDPVPEYTLVSGLPSYDAALELLQKTPNSCIIVYPSLFSVFQTNEKDEKEHPKSAEVVVVTSSSDDSKPYSIPSYDEAIAIGGQSLPKQQEEDILVKKPSQ